MSKFVASMRGILLGLMVAGMLVGCGKPEEPALASAVSKGGSGAFNGSWKVNLRASRDGCGLGLKGQVLPATVVVVQRGNKISLTIKGLAKAFKGTVTGNSLKASGTYLASGYNITGAIGAKLNGARAIKITSANLKIRSAGKVCTVVLSGSGKK